MGENSIHRKAAPQPAVGAPQPLPRMQAFAPYRQGKSEIPGREQVIKLSSNESCFGPSPRAIEAFHAAAARLHRYPDGSQSALREAIAKVHGIDPGRIVCGNGSEEVLGFLIRCFVGEADEVLLPHNHFMMLDIYAKGQGAHIVLAPERHHTVDVDALLERITPRTRVISLANPNNPTGTYVPARTLARFIEAVPREVMVILDGAYAEYPVAGDYDDGLHFADELPNVVVTRSFSKIYGLAGMRIGWGYGPAPVIEVVNRLRTPFNTNAPALAAAAAAVADQEHVRMSREHTARWQQWMRDGLIKLGFKVLPSVTNFYLLDFEDMPGRTAAAAAAFLEANGVIPRPGSSDRYLRITIGQEAENEAVLDIMARYLET